MSRNGRYFSTEEEPGGRACPEAEPLAPSVPAHQHSNMPITEASPLRPPPRRRSPVKYRPPNGGEPVPWTARLSQRASRLWGNSALVYDSSGGGKVSHHVNGRDGGVKPGGKRVSSAAAAERGFTGVVNLKCKTFLFLPFCP